MGGMIAVGCPVAHRSWVLDAWFDHIHEACDVADVEPQFVFAGDPERDRSFRVIERRAPDAIVAFAPNTKGDDTRTWDYARYQTMAAVRTLLLEAVRDLNPSFFLSIDSDILLHPEVLDLLLGDMETDPWDAIGARCYLTPTGRNCPSWGRLNSQGSLQRMDSTGYFEVPILMAIKLMRPTAYHVDYVAHLQGEDIGWSLACEQAGLKLAWDGRLGNKHVMTPNQLRLLDARVGY
jgi:hypothetical protein